MVWYIPVSRSPLVFHFFLDMLLRYLSRRRYYFEPFSFYSRSSRLDTFSDLGKEQAHIGPQNVLWYQA